MEVEQEILQRALEELQNAKQNAGSKTDYDDSFVHITIIDSEVTVTKHSHNFDYREKVVVLFIQHVCRTYDKPINGSFVIGLHDTYASEEYDNILVFSKPHANAKGQVLIPDLYAMLNYSGNLDIPDTTPFHQKRHKAFFVGSSTGSLDAASNERLRLCQWALDNTQYASCYINNVVQIKPKDVYAAYPDASDFIVDKSIPISEQLSYKYVINVDGNTCAWDRPVWIMASNSVCLWKKSNCVNWYYPFLKSGIHYIEFQDFEDIPRILRNTSIHNAIAITKNANEVVKKYMSINAHIRYTGHILYHWNNINA